ncbi:MAG: hypothetical protein AAB767_02460, partial [Patescibacteria group bacterium]
MNSKLFFYSLCILGFIFSGLFVMAPSARATTIEYVPLAPLDVRGSEFTSQGEFSKCIAPTCFPRYLRTIYNVGIALAGFFVVFSIVRGGFELLFTDSILGHSEGKAIILRALGGAVIVYASYIFMNMISPSLGRDLDLSLAFERVPKAETGRGLTVVTAEDVEAQLRAQLDRVNPQIRALADERDAKNKLAKEKEDRANATGAAAPTAEVRAALLAEAAALRSEAGLLDDRQKLIGDVNAPSERIKKANMNVLGILWDP